MCDVFANRGEYSEWKARSVKLENWQRTPRQEFSPELVQWRESLPLRRKRDFQQKKLEVQEAAMLAAAVGLWDIKVGEQ